MTILKAISIFFFVWLSILSKGSTIENGIIFQDEDFRLPTSVWPENYKLEFMVVLDATPGFERFTAPAKAWIKINCSEPTSVITMHAINLTINDNGITVKDLLTDEQIPVTGISYAEEIHFLHIDLGTPLAAYQTYEIFIEFITPISGDNVLNGMYQDFYEDVDTGETRYIATTLFAPYHARKCFPNFDEPSFRATYDITLGHASQYHAMSNTEIIETRPIENMTNWQWDTFATTPSISSYIIAMIVSDLTYEQAPANVFRNVSVRVYAKPQSIAQGAATYSAKLSGDVMTFLESLFIVPYPLSKLYSVALPQFFFSAMENWGLITYKEPVLLYLSGETTEEERYKINYVLSHELSHQYFGNLVACKWWAYVYLKEGFATYYSHHGMNQTNPELQPWANFLTKVLYVAMTFDSSNATHPLENFPTTSPAVADIYTRIPYEKGASILRLASSIVTAPVFLEGIKGYVNKFQYQSAEQDDVFEELQQSVNADPLISVLLPTTVKQILDTWTRQAGYPVLTVSTTSSTTLNISQRKFIDGDLNNPEDTWWVPIYLSVRPNDSLPLNFPDAWIPQNLTSVTINIATDQVIIVNPYAFGYYRVLYENQPLIRILKQLKSEHIVIPSEARSKIINDYAAFVISGYSELETLLQLTSFMNKETDLIVWEGIFPFLDKISKLLENTSAKLKFQMHFGEMASQALKQLELTNSQMELEIGTKSMLRSALMKITCSFGVTSCIETSSTHFNKWKQGEKIPLSLQEAVFCTSISHDFDGENWNYIYSWAKQVALNKSFSPLKSRLFESLGCSNNSENLQFLIELVKSEKILDYSEKVNLLLRLASRPIGNALLWKELNKSSSLNILKIIHSSQDFHIFIEKLCAFPLNDSHLTTLQEIRDFVPTSKRNILDNFLGQVDANEKLIKRIVWPF